MTGENKPLLLINAGISWSGTKPLCKTLQVCQKIAHHGFVIENNILCEIYIENIENLKYRPREMKTIPTKLLHTKFEREPTKTVVGTPISLPNPQLNPLTPAV